MEDFVDDERKQNLCGAVDPGHDYIYGGIKFADTHQLAGSNAKRRLYYDFYYCKKCLKVQYRQLDFTDDSYGEILFSASPMLRK